MKQSIVCLVSLVLVGGAAAGTVGCGTSTPVSPSNAKSAGPAPQVGSGAGQQIDVAALLKRLNENPQLLDSLSQEELDAIKPALEPVAVEVQEETTQVPVQAVQGVTGTSCWTTTRSDILVNVLRMKMFGIFETVNWCGNGSKITSKSVKNWGEVYMVTWQYKGASVTETGGVGAASYTAKSQGTFASCIGYIGCVSYRYPWVAITANGNGSSYYSIGG